MTEKYCKNCKYYSISLDNCSAFLTKERDQFTGILIYQGKYTKPSRARKDPALCSINANRYKEVNIITKLWRFIYEKIF